MPKTPRERIKDLYQAQTDAQWAKEQLRKATSANETWRLGNLQRMKEERERWMSYIRAEITASSSIAQQEKKNP